MPEDTRCLDGIGQPALTPATLFSIAKEGAQGRGLSLHGAPGISSLIDELKQSIINVCNGQIRERELLTTELCEKNLNLTATIIDGA